LTMDAGRSMTSPAAIWSMRWLSRTRMGMAGLVRPRSLALKGTCLFIVFGHRRLDGGAQ
jgi:hypothetical protein